MADRSNGMGRGLATKSVATIVAFALASASVGTTSLAFAQAKPAGTAAKPAAAPKAAAKPPAAAGPSAADKKKAGAHFKKGKELFDKKDYKAAKDELKSAEDLIPAGTAEYYLGRCAEELGDSADAAAWYDKSIASGKLKDDLSTDAKARLAAIKSKPVKVKVTSDPSGAIIMVDGKDSGQKTPAELDLAPGKHQITLALTGKKANDQEVDIVAGAAVTAKLEDAPATVAEDPFAKKDGPTVVTPPPTTTVAIAPDTKRDNTWVIVTGIGAVVGLGVGTVFGLKALSDKKSFDDNPTTDGRDKGTRDALIADMGFGIGITLAVTSAVLYFSGGPSSSETKAAVKKSSPISDFTFAPVVGGLKGSTGMAGASAAFHF